MSHHGNDAYNEAGIDILKHDEVESRALLTKKKVAKKMSPANHVFPKKFRRETAQMRLDKEVAKHK